MWATMMNAIKANQKREAVQAEGFCHCAGNTGFKPENKGQFFFSKHVYKYIAFNTIYFARHNIILLESEFLMVVKLSIELFQFCEKASLYWETFSGLWKAVRSPWTCCNEGHF